MNKPTITKLIARHTGRSEGGDLFNFKAASLHLADGSTFSGYIPKGQIDGTGGEVVFNTGMTGYVETLTDPSYSGQILAFTSPLIGNYGVALAEKWESQKIHLRGVVMSELSLDWSHETGIQSLLQWLQEEGIPLITGVDTRALTKHLRERGTITGIICESKPAIIKSLPFAKVSVPVPQIYNPDAKKVVVAVDCGMKENILRMLQGKGVQIKRVPHNYDYSHDNFDGILLSNGPGDPQDYENTIAILKKAMVREKPIFGICLGAQLMALAAGGKTYKLPYGHRGHNQPAITPSGRAYITSQNHGYAIDEKSLSHFWEVSFKNLNDGSVEGIRHRTKPFSAVQFHPESAPGPTDTAWLFNQFEDLL